MTGHLRQLAPLAALVLPLWLAGCRHQKVPAPPPAPVVQQPAPLTPSAITVITPLPSVPATAAPNVQPAPARVDTPTPPPAIASKHRHHRIRKAKEPVEPAQSAAGRQATEAPATAPADTAEQTGAGAQAAQQQASDAATKDLTAQWSTGTAISTQERNRMMSAIQLQEQRIALIHGAMQPETAAVILQVRSFLDKARLAVSQNDLDGAQTLNMKARVLLDELQGS